MTSPTAFITHPDCLNHNMGSTHLESPLRLEAIINQLERSGSIRLLDPIQAPQLRDESVILKAHDSALWDLIVNTAPTSGTASVSSEAIMSVGTLSAIRYGVAATIEAVERVCDGRNPNAFVAVRPPGHHATREHAMGFCFVNNAAIGAYHALDTLGLSRVAIVDIDVHHGNGTEDILANDSRLYMASTFGYGIYPNQGSHPLGDNMTNIGLRSGQTESMRQVVSSKILPALRSFSPDLIIVSAGYDAHQDDPLGNLNWTDEDYRWWFEELQNIADECSQGRLVAVLEGGYNVDVLARCVEQSILGMLRGY